MYIWMKLVTHVLHSMLVQLLTVSKKHPGRISTTINTVGSSYIFREPCQVDNFPTGRWSRWIILLYLLNWSSSHFYDTAHWVSVIVMNKIRWNAWVTVMVCWIYEKYPAMRGSTGGLTPVLTLNVLNFQREHQTYIHILCHSSALIWHRWLKYFLNYDKYLPILHSQYHGCWCPGDARSQDSSSCDIDLIKPR